jgi:hypothetical protein
MIEFDWVVDHYHYAKDGAVRRMRTRIELLVQPKSMRSIVGAPQREQLHGLACTWWLNRDAVTKQNFPPMNLQR